MPKRALNATKIKATEIIETLRELYDRIGLRFPGKNLYNLAEELLAVAKKAERRAEQIRAPHWPLRILVAVLLLGGLALAVQIGSLARWRDDLRDATVLMQFVQAAIGVSAFLLGASWGLISLERSRKRVLAMRALHELRALAHVVDMHHVDYDPEGLLRWMQRPGAGTKAAKEGIDTPFHLNRYLNYCDSLLVIIAKIAALYVQDFQDAPTVSAVDDIEDLCAGLSNRIWHKLRLLDRLVNQVNPPAEPVVRGGVAGAESA
jgi:hypothetical protein